VFLGLFLNIVVPKVTLVRHLYCIGVGLLVLGYLFADTMFHVFTMSYPVYLMMWLLPRNQQQLYCTVYLTLYMSGQHIYSMYTNYGGYDMDVRSYSMILLCKLWATSWAYKDGGDLADSKKGDGK
jgi:hypothetical protein